MKNCILLFEIVVLIFLVCAGNLQAQASTDHNPTINVFSQYGHRTPTNFCFPGGYVCITSMRLTPLPDYNRYNVSVSDYSGGGQPGPGLVHISLADIVPITPEDSVLNITTAEKFSDEISYALGYESIMLAPGSYRLDNNGEVVANAIVNSNRHVQIDFCNRQFPNNDTFKIFVASPYPPFQKLDSSSAVTNVNGLKFSVLVSFLNASGGLLYYLVIKHRNSVETWSSGLINPVIDFEAYDFTSSVSQAFGSNMELIGGRACLYSGDVNQNGSIDLSDINDIYNDAIIFNTGYLNTDLTGDDIVDLNDLSIAYNNSVSFVAVIRP